MPRVLTRVRGIGYEMLQMEVMSTSALANAVAFPANMNVISACIRTVVKAHRAIVP